MEVELVVPVGVGIQLWRGRHGESVRHVSHNTNMCSVLVVDPDDPVPLSELERQICELAADLAAATYRWLLLIAEFDARGGWSEWGVNSCAHWLSWRCGVGLNAAREYVRVARCLASLPMLAAVFSRGQLTYTKVRAVTRVAQPETESDLVEIAKHATGAQLEKVVRGYEGVIRTTKEQRQRAEELQYLSCSWDDQGMLRVEGRLTAEDGAALLTVLDDAQPPDLERALPVSTRRAQALGVVASGGSNPAEVVVHVDAMTLSSDTIEDRCELEHGPALAPEAARRLACDGSVVRILEQDGQPLSVGRRTRAISPALRRALHSRDQGCRFPGCTHTRFLHAHHIEHWARGGKTDLENLVQLCSRHHKLVHEGGYAVELGPDGNPRFWNPHGWEVPHHGALPRARRVPLEQQNQAGGVVVDLNTCRPLSAGDRLDYGIAVEGLAGKWLPSPG